MMPSNKVEIKYISGSKAQGDQIILVENKRINLLDLLRIVQEIAKNEQLINKATIARTGRFFFKEAINDAIDGVALDEIRKKYLLRG